MWVQAEVVCVSETMSEDVNSVTELEPGDLVGANKQSLYRVLSIEEPEEDPGPFGDRVGSVEVEKKGMKLLPGKDDDWSGDGEVREFPGDKLVNSNWKRFDEEEL